MDYKKTSNDFKEKHDSSSSSSDSDQHLNKLKNYESSSSSNSIHKKRKRSKSSKASSKEVKKNLDRTSSKLLNKLDSPKRNENQIIDKGNSSNLNNKYKSKTKRKSDYKEDSYSSGEGEKHIKTNSTDIKEKVKRYVKDRKKTEKIFRPGLDGPLVSFILFSELQHSNLKTEEIEEAYKNYKNDYENKRYQSFYIEHQHNEWFKEKYDPELNFKWKVERNHQSKKLYDNFITNLNQNYFNGLKLELRSADENNKNIKIINYGINKDNINLGNENENINVYGSYGSSNGNASSNNYLIISSDPFFGFDPDKMTLFLHQIPKNISRCDILDVLKKLPGFISMSMSEPIKNQDFVRYCWVTFDSEENTESAFESLNNLVIDKDYKLNPIKSKSTTNKKIRVTPPLFDERVVEDLELSKSIISILDKEKSIEQNLLIDGKESRTKEFQLDLQILYLRRVHGFCYYCMEEYDDERMLSTRCGNIHVRSYKKLGARRSENTDQFKTENEWEKNFVKLVKTRVEKGPIISKKIIESNDELNIKRNEYCKLQTQEISQEKFICMICNKMFKGANFVHNHIFNKHMNMINDLVDKPFYEKLKYDNFLKDKNKIVEKHRVMHTMDEYLQYINTIKNLEMATSNLNSSSGYYHHYSSQKNHSSSSNYRKKTEKKEFKDLDDPENANINTNIGGRALISYDDL